MTQEVLDTIISVQPKDSATGALSETREMNVARQAKEMLEKLPPAYDPFEVKARLQIMGITQSMNIFLKQEIDRMQIIIKLVHSMLTDLLLAIEGVIIMNEASDTLLYVHMYFFLFSFITFLFYVYSHSFIKRTICHKIVFLLI